METAEKNLRSRTFNISLIIGIFCILFLCLFWNEITLIPVLFVCASLICIVTLLLGGQWLEVFLLSFIILAITGLILVLRSGVNIPFTLNQQTVVEILQWDNQKEAALWNLAYALISFGAVFCVSMWLVARFVLPVQTRAEHRDVLGRLWLYIRGRHGKAISVKDGKLVSSAEEKDRKGPGIALVDSASAIVLEKEMPPEQTIRESIYGKRSALLQSIYEAEKKAWRIKLTIIAALLRNLRWIMVMPSRLLRRFLLKASLLHPRKFKHPKPAARVLGPGIVLVEDDENVRATLDLRKQTRSRKNIKGITRDGIEVTTQINVIFRLDADIVDETERNRRAYPFNAHSGFRAIYGTPVIKQGETGEELVQEWTDLPAFVASDIFRDMIAAQNFDNLFRPDHNVELPLNDFRREFGERVTRETVLRERGIRILNAGFSKLSPNEKVDKQRLETWQAPWHKTTTETLAAGDLQAARIIQRERANAQYDMMKNLADILRDKRVTKTAVVLRLFKSLESASADPSVRRLLAGDTVEILSKWTGNLRSWVGVGNDDDGEKT
ncbi:MAG: hypothetical protein HZC38_18050 [Chloroflexi bacterium]|nr:hypothetical protein [Chloroflexota bacterium]